MSEVVQRLAGLQPLFEQVLVVRVPPRSHRHRAVLPVGTRVPVNQSIKIYIFKFSVKSYIPEVKAKL